jgi:GxxExxY protein
MMLPSNATRDPQTYAIIGAAMEVHRELGCGFLEAVYHDAMEIEFIDRGLPYEREVDLPIYYKGRLLPSRYRADFVCFGNVIVELKAIKTLGDIERAQCLNYLKSTGFHRALLINFGAISLEYERFVL